MPNTPEPLDLTSHTPTTDKITELLRLFPEIRTEGNKLDFDRLKLTLGETVDTGKERYGMNWPGKADCFKTIQAPSLGTLRPAPEESINFDTSENLIIEGDNLEVLKLLQKSYMGKVKMIYIDPPYNTGNDFIYPDNYSDNLETYMEYSGQIDNQGHKFGTNNDTDGRFHSKWMNMMYPRLYLARNLLREDGAIFISIDDAEVTNLRRLCDEIFGEENFVEEVIWKNKYNSGALTKGFSNVHEYIVCYSKFPDFNILSPLSSEQIEEYNKNRDEKFSTRGGFVTQPLSTGSKDERPNLRYPITINGKEVWPDKQWLWSKDRAEHALRNGELVLNDTNGKLSIRSKQYLRGENGLIRQTKPLSLLVGPYNQEGRKDIESILGGEIFDFPKPVALIKYLASISIHDDQTSEGIYLDFFAGSGTTAQAVLDLNNQDGGTRKFILVQLPEPTEREDYTTIAEITKERVRRVIKKLNAENAGTLDMEGASQQDRGFKVFKLDHSNFTTWDSTNPSDAETLGKQLELHVDHIRENRTQNDILFEILLKSGFPLETSVEKISLEGKIVYSVAGGGLLICLEDGLTFELIRAMASQNPERVVCLDVGFAKNDQLKTNAVQTFKSKNIVFRTV